MDILDCFTKVSMNQYVIDINLRLQVSVIYQLDNISEFINIYIYKQYLLLTELLILINELLKSSKIWSILCEKLRTLKTINFVEYC